MTTVYEPYFEPGYDWAMPAGSVEPILDLKTRRRGDPWKPLWMYMTTTDAQGRPRQRADMPWHGHGTLVLTAKARQVLEKALGDDAELLPAYDTQGQDLWLVHAWRVVDALDEERSDVVRFTSGKIMTVRRFALRAGAVAGLRCFRLPEQLATMLVTSEVVAAVRSAGLHGTTFRPVWPSGHTSQND